MEKLIACVGDFETALEKPITPREREHLRSGDRGGAVMVRKLPAPGDENVKARRDPRGVIRGREAEVIRFDLVPYLLVYSLRIARAGRKEIEYE